MSRVLEFVLALAAGLIAVAWMIAVLVLGLDDRWFTIPFSAALMVGFFVFQFRSLLRRGRFWVLASIAVVIHICVSGFLFAREIPNPVVALLFVGELFVFGVLIARFARAV
jgi:peptidoglycan/LPS O-acetylase OafA/YrhL